MRKRRNRIDFSSIKIRLTIEMKNNYFTIRIFLVLLLFKKKDRIINLKISIVNGLFAGFGNGASGLFTLYLAAEKAGGMLFPIISVSTITVSLICGRIIFGEKLARIQLLGFISAIFSVLFLQM